MADNLHVYAKLRDRYIGVDPALPHTVYSDREHAGAWEEIELIPQPDPAHPGKFTARFVAANVVLSIQPDGRFETRPAGTAGEYEVCYATQQPDPHGFLYRYSGQGALVLPVLVIEEVK